MTRAKVRGFVAFTLSLGPACQSAPSASPEKPRPNATAAGPAAPPRGAPLSPTTKVAPPAPPAAATSTELATDVVELLTGGATATMKVPLIVALHGLGDTPGSFVSLFEGFDVPARIVAPHSTTLWSGGFSWFPPGGIQSGAAPPSMSRMADALAAFATALSRDRPTRGKPILMGFSQGGALSFAVAARHPESVAAAFPVGGWLPPPLTPTSRPKVSPTIIAFHGTADDRVPFELDRAAIDHLSQLGFDARLRDYPGVGHAIPAEVRRDLFAALAEACKPRP